MRTVLPFAKAIAILALPAVAVACSSTPSGGMDGGAAISFKNDLQPKFAQACGLSSSCHQQPVTDPKVQRIFLGCNPSPDNNCPTGDIWPMVYMELLMNKSQELTMGGGMPYVTPKDPTKSYLYLKLDGSMLSSLASQCDANSSILMTGSGQENPLPPCGGQMPLGMMTALQPFTDNVRAWIMQGAPNN